MSRRYLLTNAFQLNVPSHAFKQPPNNIANHDYGISDYASFTARLQRRRSYLLNDWALQAGR